MAASVSVRIAGSNAPCEDRYSIRTSKRGQGIEAFVVIDGHGGNLAADITCASLLELIFKRLEVIPKDGRQPEMVVGILDQCFVDCDKMVLDEAVRITTLREQQRNCEILNRGVGAAGTAEKSASNTGGRTFMKPTGRAGCCVLVLLILDGLMYTAHVGDCRAKLVQEIAPNSEPPRKKAKLEGGSAKEIEADGALSVTLDSKSGFYCQDSFLETTLVSPSSFNGSGKGYSRDHLMKARQEDGNYYVHRNEKMGIEVSAITLDHGCDSVLEGQLVKALTIDTNPIRCSINGSRGANRRVSNIQQPLRVAGSLAVTRAIGDGYLKVPSLSVKPYKDYCPYITCRPTISWRKLRASDRAIILASDGLYNFVTPEEMVGVMLATADYRGTRGTPTADKGSLPENLDYRSHMPQALSLEEGRTYVPVDGSDRGKITSSSSHREGNGSVFSSALQEEAKSGSIWSDTEQDEGPAAMGGEDSDFHDPAEQLLQICFRKAAASINTSVEKLKSMAAGEVRRSAIDDVTVMVVQLRQQQEDEEEQKPVQGDEESPRKMSPKEAGRPRERRRADSI